MTKQMYTIFAQQHQCTAAACTPATMRQSSATGKQQPQPRFLSRLCSLNNKRLFFYATIPNLDSPGLEETSDKR